MASKMANEGCTCIIRDDKLIQVCSAHAAAIRKSSTKYRIHEWINTETGEVMFGIQAQPEGTRRWIHGIKDNELCVFDSKEEARAFIKQQEEEDERRAKE